MTIKILPARLANQIAAGEVVERPASVVKELVENSLDSGATRIDVDIEKGGAKLIRVRDNGKGIEKEELSLALSRHATSKIHCLDDLEAIVSLGFRGEALASISSVSRLTMTSRPATQEQAWSAYSEGRDMQVKLTPTAHPIGTSVEVLDLFFNTPARRKFLRTEKTEFTHIDELMKRIALSCFDVTINLTHNGKSVRQYRAAKSEVQAEKRISAVCGSHFVKNMLKIELEHQGLCLHGWITTPEGARQQNDLQYCYVNGRMMRDKLINHAIRQSYENTLRADQFPTYILFIEIDPHQVDVNVHPAKHEVRFHQARLVHDFIYQALSDALAQSEHICSPKLATSAFHQSSQASSESDKGPIDINPKNENKKERGVIHDRVSPQIMAAIDHSPMYPNKVTSESNDRVGESSPTTPNSAAHWRGSQTPTSGQMTKPVPVDRASPKELQVYSELLTTENEKHTPRAGFRNVESVIPELVPITSLGKAINVVHGRYILMASKQSSVLVSLAKAEWLRIRGQLDITHADLTSQPLLVPLSLKVDENQHLSNQRLQSTLSRLGIQIKERNKQSLMVMGVPQPLRQQNLQIIIPDLLSYLATNDLESDSDIDPTYLINWLSDRITQVKTDYTLSEAIQIIAELEQLWHGQLPLDDPKFVQPIDFSATIAALLA
ncbi:DNA mismatch repair endonuclease MutL [Vibrio genomosp. F10]|uniref:DNA mismatch repair endonuclease MutL n=1 Tax=Vibrio genomosp. F10 TaxID=723171 RepID=UPI0002D4F44D|nr:DNA mismatch repair endonuclease MutL [Vibrio genomosp. F10]OEF05746.1 DNA mismatch repair protein MutL [Vibrio genomosp. F10 str. 9ZB36]